MKLLLSLLLSLFGFGLLSGQVAVSRNFDIELAEKDSLKSARLEAALNAFLTEAQDYNYSNKYVDSTHLKEFEFFFSKLAGIGKDNNAFNAPTVLKSYTPDGKNYRITVAFTGVKDDVPFVFQVTEFKVVPYKDHYRFYCPFQDRTSSFKTRKISNVTYHYNSVIDMEKAEAFAAFKDELSALTNTANTPLDYYCFESLDELLRAYGFLYSARQCNFLCYDLGFTDDQGKAYLTGTNNENYSFGYIGDFLYYHLPNKEQLYWPFVNGISTYYGGYGLSYDDMKELKRQFRNELSRNPDIDFLEEFNKGRKSSVNRHFSYYVISAFLCEEAIKQKGFDRMLELAYSGEDGHRFFDALKEVLGVDQENFHETVVRLINES